MTLELALNRKEVRSSLRDKSFPEILKKLESEQIPFEIGEDISWVTEDTRGYYIEYSGQGLNTKISRNNASLLRTGELSDSDKRLIELIEQEYPDRVEKLPWFAKLTIAAPFLTSAALGIYSLHSGRNMTEEMLGFLTVGAFLFMATGVPHAIGYHRNKTPIYWQGSEILSAYRLKNLVNENEFR